MTTRKLQRHGSGDSSVIIDPTETAVVIEAESSKKLQSSQYKGVVPQPNGRWGAQIYEKHQRVWLGTFNEQSDAARAYDVAAQRFRGRDAVTNFASLSDADTDAHAELDFLTSHSKSEIVDMLRKHTYDDELLQRKRSRVNSQGKNDDVVRSFDIGSRVHLFDKTVTPSDVGKLNRLVIPKQHAEKHFPTMMMGGGTGMLLNFEDGNGKVWRFRYSYWNSSQSYVLTKGWSRFVKEKGLEAGDVVGFEEYCGGGDQDVREKKLYIECKKRGRSVKVFRLFGVDVMKVEEEGGLDHEGWINGNGKRTGGGCRGLDLFFNKQFVGAF